MITIADINKISLLRELACIPLNDGEQWIDVYLMVNNMTCGEIRWGFHWKTVMGSDTFLSIDEAIEKVRKLRSLAKL